MQQETTFQFAAPVAPTMAEFSHVEAQLARRARDNDSLQKRFSTMLADQLQLPTDSLLRCDIIAPMEYDDVVPQVQAEMAAHIKDFTENFRPGGPTDN